VERLHEIQKLPKTARFFSQIFPTVHQEKKRDALLDGISPVTKRRSDCCLQVTLSNVVAIDQPNLKPFKVQLRSLYIKNEK